MKTIALTIDVFDHNANRIVEMKMKMVEETQMPKGLKRIWLGHLQNLPNGGDARLEITEYPEKTVNYIERSASINSPESAIEAQFLSQLK